MGVRLYFIVEGQTEEAFVKRVLAPHLARKRVWAKVRCVMTSHKHGIKYRGGFRKYATPKNDVYAWITEDQNPDARFTTMFDLYALPSDFPGYTRAPRTLSPYDRVKVLEDALEDDISDLRFILYIQLHEIEALLFSNPWELLSQFPDRERAIQRLVAAVSKFDSPELINDSPDTAPSKRIIKEIPQYEGSKVSAGPVVAEKIGLSTLRTKCRHFAEWLDRLEALAE